MVLRPIADMDLPIREIAADEFALLWPIFREVVAAGDTYSYPPDIGFEEARHLWTGGDARCFVAELDGACVGGYLLHANQPGLGDHVANAGYMVAPAMRGRGIAGAMCEHSLQEARAAGFLAMQFNFVASTNSAAVHLCRSTDSKSSGACRRRFATAATDWSTCS